MRKIIKNSESHDIVLNFNDGSCVVLKPNEYWEVNLEIDQFEVSSNDGSHWDVVIPVIDLVVLGSWKKEGF
jgi:hypothetical protein